MRTTVTSRYIPTVGEHAEHALASFMALQNAAVLAPEQRSATARLAAVEFVHACLALMQKFPMQARLDFASALPFTELELELIGRGHLEEAVVADAAAQRLLRWARGHSVCIDQANVPAADFLARLTPHLDLWNQRQQAAAATEWLVHARQAPAQPGRELK